MVVQRYDPEYRYRAHPVYRFKPDDWSRTLLIELHKRFGRGRLLVLLIHYPTRGSKSQQNDSLGRRTPITDLTRQWYAFQIPNYTRRQERGS